MALIKIDEDLFFITRRIKEIDNDYFIVYNTEKERYEVHNYKQPISTFCLVVRDNKLNASLLEYVRKTRSENQKKLLLEIEENNRKVQKQKTQEIIEESAFKFEEHCFENRNKRRRP